MPTLISDVWAATARIAAVAERGAATDTGSTESVSPSQSHNLDPGAVK